MLNGLPTDKKRILLIAHNSDYDCRFVSEHLQNKRPIVKSNRCLHVKTTYYNPIRKNTIKIIVQGSYKLFPMPLRDFGKCFNLDCHKEVMPYGIYTHQNVEMGACRIQDALDIIEYDDKQHFLDNLEKWDCILGKGMDNQILI